MPLKLAHFDDPSKPKGQVAVLNKWADWVETQLHATQQKIFKVASTAVSTGGGGGVTSVGLAMPKEFTVSGSPVTSAGTLTAAWQTELTNTFLGVPPPGLTGLETIGLNKGASSVPTVTATPTASTSLGILCTTANGAMTMPSGWTQIANASDALIGYRSISGTSPVTAADISSFTSWVSALLLFTGPAPAFIQQKNTGTKSGTVAYTSNNTAGNTLFIVMQSQNGGGGPLYGITASDSRSNAYSLLVSQQNSGSASSTQTAAFVATNCAAGSNTITFNFSGFPQAGSTYSTTIFEFGPLPAGSQLPSFINIPNTALPPINLGTTGNGGIAGLLSIANGGTGADLSLTGGAHQYVAQTTGSGPFVVQQPDYPDLAGATGQIATTYNGSSLQRNGLVSEVGSAVNLTAQSAAIAATNLIASTPAAGLYRISYVAKVTTVATTSSTLGGTNGFQVKYTDQDDSVVVTTPTWWTGNNNGAAPTSASLNTTQTYISGVITVNAKSATAIQYLIDYTSSGATAMQYNLHITLERM